MSNFSDDKQVLEKPRKALDIEEVSLKEKIVQKLYDTCLDEDVGQKVAAAWNTESANIQDLLERQQVYLQDIDVHAEADANDTGGGSSNLHIPMPYIVAKAYKARFYQALWGVDPPFNVKARRAESQQSQQVVEDLMRYTVYSWANRFKGLESAVQDWIGLWVDQGTGILKTRWLNEYCRYIDVVPVEKPMPPKFVVDPQTGKEVAIPQRKLVEEEQSITQAKFRGPMAEVVALEDFAMVGGNGDPDQADLVIHRTWYTASDIWSNVDQGLFDADAAEQVIESGKSNVSAGMNSDIKTQRASNAGKGSLDSANAEDRYEILEAYLRMDVDNSGIAADIVVWVHVNTRALLRATFLHRISPTGERPFAVAHFSKRFGQEYAAGLLELLHPLSVELDAIHNIKIDFGMITANPVFFYRASSTLDPKKIEAEPGMGIPVDDPQKDVYFPQRPSSVGFLGNEEAVVQSYIERLTGISDLSLGAMSGTQGAARTATGARALLGESNTNLNIHLANLNQAWRKALRMIFHLLQQRVDGEFCFRVTGDDGRDVFRQATSYDLAFDYDFEVSNNSANSNKAVQIETAQQILQMQLNPLLMQAGIVTPGSLFEGIKNWAQSMGIKNVQQFFTKPQGYEYQPTPEEVFQRVARGMSFTPNMNMDIPGILSFFERMLEAQEQQQTLSEDMIGRVIDAVRQLRQLQAAMEQQAAQAQVQAQMRANSAMSGQQASPGVNPMEGGMMPANPGQLPIG